jgi:hypothetical protein
MPKHKKLLFNHIPSRKLKLGPQNSCSAVAERWKTRVIIVEIHEFLRGPWKCALETPRESLRLKVV